MLFDGSYNIKTHLKRDGGDKTFFSSLLSVFLEPEDGENGEDGLAWEEPSSQRV